MSTCAIVFSSGSLLRHEFGPEIDAHDSVTSLSHVHFPLKVFSFRISILHSKLSCFPRFNSRTAMGTCAIVFSSGSLLRHEFGPEIDAHDEVLRFNYAPVEDFERFVGNKTTWVAGSSLLVEEDRFAQIDDLYVSLFSLQVSLSLSAFVVAPSVSLCHVCRRPLPCPFIASV